MVVGREKCPEPASSSGSWGHFLQEELPQIPTAGAHQRQAFRCTKDAGVGHTWHHSISKVSSAVCTQCSEGTAQPQMPMNIRRAGPRGSSYPFNRHPKTGKVAGWRGGGQGRLPFTNRTHINRAENEQEAAIKHLIGRGALICMKCPAWCVCVCVWGGFPEEEGSCQLPRD